jgi:glycosyltransferase involved in cell wall biosynthesis
MIGDGVQARLFLRSAQMLARTTGADLPSLISRPNSTLTDGSLARELHLDLGASKTASALRLMKHHSEFGLGVHRISAQRILKADNLRDHDNELRLLAQLATGAGLRNHPLVQRLRNAHALREPVQETDTPHPLMDKAQALAPEGIKYDLPLTRYMMQFHTALSLEVEFPLGTKSEAETYIRCFNKRGFERAPSKWLPLAPISQSTHRYMRRGTASNRKETKSEAVYRTVLDLLTNPGTSIDENDPILKYLCSNPVGIGPSRFAVLLAILCQIPCQFDPEKPLWKSEDIRSWFNATVCGHVPGFRKFSTPQSRRGPDAPRIDIYGMPNSETGLGTNTHMAELMLNELELPYAMHDIEAPDRDVQLPAQNENARQINRNLVLHHMNADRIPLFVMSPELSRRNDQYHIGYLLWELAQIPDAHRLGVDMLDEIWAPSRFVAALYSQQSETPVHLIKKGLVHLDALKLMSLRQHRPANPFTALVCFDFHSSVERKNPLAAVQGFLSAFPKHSHRDCRLIVKTTPTSANHWGDPTHQMQSIRALAKQDKRIQIVERFLPEPALWQMMAEADCILSTHRAEGFGYIPAYALALGKPLIVTDFGGSRDFCSTRTSFPVTTDLVEVPKGHALHFQEGAVWADVSPDAVADQLTKVYANLDAAKDRGIFGQDFVTREYSIAAYAARCRKRLLDIGIL